MGNGPITRCLRIAYEWVKQMVSKYPTLTLGDCVTLLDNADAAIAVIDRHQAGPHAHEIMIKSMLSTLRREVATRIVEINRQDRAAPPFSN